MSALQYLVETFINGNISHAKEKAKRFSYLRIREGFITFAGYSFKKASLAADVLKHGGSFQKYCDCL